MYRAKAGGRALVVYFEERMNDEAVARVTLDRDLRSALEQGQLSMHYQPLLDLGSGALVGAEALIRWHHPERGWIDPSRFIPVAEETGFIDELGHFALTQACAQVRAWRDAGLPACRVSVNVSPRQLRKPGIVRVIADCAREAGIGLDALQIEITEGLLIGHADTVDGLLRELADAGVTIALDDFGTGFSSMAYLTRFPIHTLKIDRLFVEGIEHGRDSTAIVEAIIARRTRRQDRGCQRRPARALSPAVRRGAGLLHREADARGGPSGCPGPRGARRTVQMAGMTPMQTPRCSKRRARCYVRAA